MLRAEVTACVKRYPWWGYKRIAVVCRRQGIGVSNRLVYRTMRETRLLQRRRVRDPETYQAVRLFELLPSASNALWQMDITWVHVPGHRFSYAITVIDYHFRYLLMCRFSASLTAGDVQQALDDARSQAERIHGELECMPVQVTDNEPSFISRRFGMHVAERYRHVCIGYRTPTQLGLLERFHLR